MVKSWNIYEFNNIFKEGYKNYCSCERCCSLASCLFYLSLFDLPCYKLSSSICTHKCLQCMITSLNSCYSVPALYMCLNELLTALKGQEAFAHIYYFKDLIKFNTCISMRFYHFLLQQIIQTKILEWIWNKLSRFYCFLNFEKVIWELSMNWQQITLPLLI